METKNLVSSFYKYVKIENPAVLQKEIFQLCESMGLEGRILLGEEGINGSVYGAEDKINLFKESLRNNILLSDIEFKESETEKIAFRKLFVRIRKEVVHSGLKVNLENTADFVTPKQLKEMLDKNEEIVLVDMRNDYEAKIGRFRNAVTLSMRNFRDLPKVISEIENLKEKKIVTYCTGGIRCEKSSAYLKENGFENVMQLKGGILKFGEEYPDTYWEGKCFVFDDRLAIDLNKKNKDTLNNCAWCSKPCDDYTNCHNLDCDRLFICCEECKEPNNKSCCGGCKSSPKRRKEFNEIGNQLTT
ncbi:rhodanese-related sulfurtransferase [Candidatus Woesearchaeota archaeon]|nr:rhodanese-related sulfurtransferase [Candidatus Woesearchaeota archaeon]